MIRKHIYPNDENSTLLKDLIKKELSKHELKSSWFCWKLGEKIKLKRTDTIVSNNWYASIENSKWIKIRDFQLQEMLDGLTDNEVIKNDKIQSDLKDKLESFHIQQKGNLIGSLFVYFGTDISLFLNP